MVDVNYTQREHIVNSSELQRTGHGRFVNDINYLYGLSVQITVTDNLYRQPIYR